MKSPFLEKVRNVFRVKHYSIRTEKSYLYWIKYFILFHKKQHPAALGEKEIESFLTFLAVKKQVSPATQAQALNALLFLYKQVLKKDIQNVADFTRPKKKKKLPIVLTRDEIAALLSQLENEYWLMACLMYGSGF